MFALFPYFQEEGSKRGRIKWSEVKRDNFEDVCILGLCAAVSLALEDRTCFFPYITHTYIYISVEMSDNTFYLMCCAHI